VSVLAATRNFAGVLPLGSELPTTLPERLRDNAQSEYIRGDSMIDSAFYLHFTEGFEDEKPRFCVSKGRVELGDSGEFGLLVSVSPPLSASRYASCDPQIDLLVLIARMGRTFPITEWPFYVRVFVPTVPHPELHQRFQKDDLNMIAIGALQQSI